MSHVRMSHVMTSLNSFVTLVTVTTALHLASPSSGAQLPLAIEVDQLLVRAEREIGSSDYDQAITTFDRILELYRGNGEEIPAEFWINDAQLAQKAGLGGRAIPSPDICKS